MAIKTESYNPDRDQEIVEYVLTYEEACAIIRAQKKDSLHTALLMGMPGHRNEELESMDITIEEQES